MTRLGFGLSELGLGCQNPATRPAHPGHRLRRSPAALAERRGERRGGPAAAVAALHRLLDGDTRLGLTADPANLLTARRAARRAAARQRRRRAAARRAAARRAAGCAVASRSGRSWDTTGHGVLPRRRAAEDARAARPAAVQGAADLRTRAQRRCRQDGARVGSDATVPAARAQPAGLHRGGVCRRPCQQAGPRRAAACFLALTTFAYGAAARCFARFGCGNTRLRSSRWRAPTAARTASGGDGGAIRLGARRHRSDAGGTRAAARRRRPLQR